MPAVTGATIDVPLSDSPPAQVLTAAGKIVPPSRLTSGSTLPARAVPRGVKSVGVAVGSAGPEKIASVVAQSLAVMVG